MTIHTRANGTPIRKPERSEFKDGIEFLRAFHAYKDEIAATANESFDKAYQKELKKLSSSLKKL